VHCKLCNELKVSCDLEAYLQRYEQLVGVMANCLLSYTKDSCRQEKEQQQRWQQEQEQLLEMQG